tara:strand:- start:58 stop:873 length:816 start_codon:yes stop_codon:yes gene_type:complete
MGMLKSYSRGHQDMAQTANVICIKWGNKYDASEVNRLFRMVNAHIKKHNLAFYCFTDDTQGLDKSIITKDLPVLNVAPEDNRYFYKKEAALCDDNLGGLKGQRVLFLDIDVVITGSLDDFFEYPKGDEFITTNDWNTRDDSVGQASCYSWVVGTIGFVKSDFEAEPKRWIKKYRTASQEYLSYKIIERFGKLNFWPESWVRSFKFHSLPVWYMRPYVTPVLPEDTRVLCFHGDPKVSDAMMGRWSEKKIPPLKRLYKTIRPSPWLKKYLSV